MSKFFILAVNVAVVSSATFSYDRCNAVTGPSAWTGSCNPNQQNGSPINVCNSVPFTSKPSMNALNYGESRIVNIFDNGYTVEITAEEAPRANLTLGNIESIVRPWLTPANPPTSWVLEQMHLHWGRTDKADEGSEHYLEGARFPMEAHFVHHNSAFESVSQAAASGRQDALLVVGVFLQISSTDVPLMTAIASNVSGLTRTPTPLSPAVQLSDLFDGSGDYYSYAGSLTTPGCNAVVTWVVMKAPKPITTATLNKIKQASADPGVAGAALISLYGNFRPLQVLGNRTVYTSGSTPGASCTTATDPVFTCTSAALMVSPPILSSVVVLFSTMLLVAKH